jgi:hypothetical protein
MRGWRSMRNLRRLNGIVYGRLCQPCRAPGRAESNAHFDVWSEEGRRAFSGPSRRQKDPRSPRELTVLLVVAWCNYRPLWVSRIRVAGIAGIRGPQRPSAASSWALAGHGTVALPVRRCRCAVAAVHLPLCRCRRAVARALVPNCPNLPRRCPIAPVLSRMSAGRRPNSALSCRLGDALAWLVRRMRIATEAPRRLFHGE